MVVDDLTTRGGGLAELARRLGVTRQAISRLAPRRLPRTVQRDARGRQHVPDLAAALLEWFETESRAPRADKVDRRLAVARLAATNADALDVPGERLSVAFVGRSVVLAWAASAQPDEAIDLDAWFTLPMSPATAVAVAAALTNAAREAGWR